MPDLRDQIRIYLDETSEPVGLDEVYDVAVGVGKVRPLTRFPIRSRIPTGVLVAGAVAALALILVGIPLLLARSNNQGPAGDPTTTTMPTTTTTIESESAPTTTRPVAEDVTAGVVPGLGTLTWERIDGDETTLPRNIAEFVDGWYVAYETSGRWTSPDAVTWTFERVDSFEYLWFEVRDEWAIGYTEAGSDLLRRDGDAWVPVDLPPADIPEVTGLAWRAAGEPPLQSNGAVIVMQPVIGRVPWEDVFGVFEYDCGQPEPCESPPLASWGPNTPVRIEHPEDGSLIAQVGIVIDGNEARFVNETTGELLITISADGPDYPIERVVDELQVYSSVNIQGGYVSSDGGVTWDWVTFPWPPRFSQIVVVPDGGFAAYELEYDWDLMDPLVGVVAWTSTDGRTWVDSGPLPLVSGVDHFSVQETADQLIATTITSSGLFQTYVSTNGLDWQPTDLPFPHPFEETETEFGTVRFLPGESSRFWVSTDAAEWHEVEGPRGANSGSAPGTYGLGGAVGDVLFGTSGTDSGDRTLWIGRFAP